MVRKLIVAGFIAGALAIPAVARAHTGHAHKVMGTVSSIEGNHVMVKTTDGKTVMVMLDAKTKITQGKTPLTSAALTGAVGFLLWTGLALAGCAFILLE